MAKKNSKVEHKCWYCMTDIEKNDWLKVNNFEIRYPINYTSTQMNFTTMSGWEADIYLARIYNPRELIPIGF